MARFKIIFLIAVLAIASCTTVNLTEKDAFDIKRTITPEFFENSSFEVEEVQIQSGDSLVLNGWYIHHDSSNGTVLYFGGNGFVMVTSYHIINSIIDQTVNLLVFDYRGYGENPGKPTVEGLKQDGLAAYNFLVSEKGIRPKNLAIHGHSLGSYIATYVASERQAAGLTLECPITDAKDWTGMLMPWFLKPLVKFDIETVLLENSNLERITKIEKPVLILAGESDPITPPGMAEKLYKAAKSSDKTLSIINGGGHNDLPLREMYKNSLNEFYRKIFNN